MMEANNPTSRSRVVLLTNPLPHTLETARILIHEGVNLVGIVCASDKTAGIPVAQYQRALRRNGVILFLHKALGSLVYQALNGRRDMAYYKSLYRMTEIGKAIRDSRAELLHCAKYDEPYVIDEIVSMKPDVLVVHSESWVPRKVREIPTSGLVVGGHPGLTPHYRGGHSTFWALYNEKPEDLGWTVFHVDAGVDTGDVISQGSIAIEPGDSFYTLSWRAMREIAKEQATVILDYGRGGAVPRSPHRSIPEGTVYGTPTLFEYIRYRRRQNWVR